jgi:hypothetical protein
VPLLSSSALAVLLTSPSDPILGARVQTVDGVSTFSFSTNHPGNESPPQAIDQNVGTKYLNFDKEGTGILVDASNDVLVLTGIELLSANDARERDPASFSIYGTNATLTKQLSEVVFSDFSLIVADQAISIPDERNGASSGLVTFANPQNAPFDSYLVVFPTLKNAAGTNSMQVAEIRLDGTVAIPEPSTLGLLGLTTFGIASLRRRRR